MATDLKPNEGKKGVIEVDGVQYLRLPIPTHLITDQDNICDVAQQYGAPLLQPGDVLFIDEIHRMEYALRECGTLRILFAAFVSVIGKKLFRKKGWFYKVAGYKARSIDGPCHNTIPPYNHYVVLGPVNPDQVARDIRARIGFETCIVDINDLEGQILGVSSKALDRGLYARILKDNPLGQDDQQTPMGIIRKI